MFLIKEAATFDEGTEALAKCKIRLAQRAAHMAQRSLPIQHTLRQESIAATPAARRWMLQEISPTRPALT